MIPAPGYDLTAHRERRAIILESKKINGDRRIFLRKSLHLEFPGLDRF